MPRAERLRVDEGVRRRQRKVNRWVLSLVALVSLVLFYVVNRSVRTVRSRSYELKLAAASLSEQALGLAGKYRQQKGVPVDSVNDPNGTGLIGVQYSLLTYGRSDLSDALTTTNPNFSAALVEMLQQAGVRPGDSIAISMDGTYPALNVQMLAVAKAMNLRPAMVTALSAGAWGANYPGLTWPELERMFVQAGLWRFRSRWADLGGEDGRGQGLSPEGRAVLTAAAESGGVAVQTGDPVELRVKAADGTRAFVAIGRAVADIGDPRARVASRVFRGRGRALAGAPRGAIRALRAKAFPVVYVGNPSEVALDHHLPVAPVPIPEAGKGRQFFERRYSAALSGLFAAVLLALLVFAVRYDVEWYFGAREESGEKEAV
jgi:poly-gamma-glutamate system protein